jgi:2-oxoglutarate ferredoxin oxidoreductase subunit delta
MLCADFCPKKIIGRSSRLNNQGYNPAEAPRMDQCTGCASCAMICPDCAIRVFRSSKRPRLEAEYSAGAGRGA